MHSVHERQDCSVAEPFAPGSCLSNVLLEPVLVPSSCAAAVLVTNVAAVASWLGVAVIRLGSSVALPAVGAAAA